MRSLWWRLTMVLSATALAGEAGGDATPTSQGLVILGLAPGGRSLSEVKRKLGETKTQEEGAIRSICYRGKDGTVLRFESDLVRASDDQVTAVVLADHGGKDCAASLLVQRDLTFDNGARLGMTDQQLWALCPAASAMREDGRRVFSFATANPWVLSLGVDYGLLGEVEFLAAGARELRVTYLKSRTLQRQ